MGAGKEKEKEQELVEQEELRLLASIQEDLDAARRSRRQRALVSLLGILLLLAAIAIFARNMWDFVRNYDTDALNRALQARAADLAASDDFKLLVHTITKEALPQLKDAVAAKFQAELPAIQERAGAAAANIEEHLHRHFRSKLESAVQRSLDKTRAMLLDKHRQLDPDKMQLVFDRAQEIFIEQMQECLEKHWNKASKELAALQLAVEDLNTPEERTSLASVPSEDLEGGLIEAMLELAIYQINPDKGSLPAEL